MSGWNSEGRQWRIMLIKRRDGYRCWLCHGRFARSETVTIDHAIPKARGGTNHLHNLRLAHGDCNNVRGAIQETQPKAAKQRLSSFPLLTRVSA